MAHSDSTPGMPIKATEVADRGGRGDHRIKAPYRGFALVPDTAENPSTRLFAAVFAGHAPDPIGMRWPRLPER